MERRAQFLLLLLGLLALAAGPVLAAERPYVFGASPSQPSDPQQAVPVANQTPPPDTYDPASAQSRADYNVPSQDYWRSSSQRRFQLETKTGTPWRDPAVANAGMLQIERLPPVGTTTPLSVDPAAQYGQQFPGGVLLPDDDPIADQESARKGLPPGMRRAGCFQSVNLGGSWLATGTGNDALGIAAADVRGEFILPSLIPESFLMITPGFGVHRFDNPGGHDIPEEVYDARIGFGLKGRYSDRLSYQTVVTVGSHSDFENDNAEAVRVRGYGSAIWKWNPKVELMFGVAYVDLQDWPVLPIGGLIIRPDDCQILRATFPRMEYSRRLATTGMLGPKTEYWGLIGLEMGGGRWIVSRRDGSVGDLTYRDWRVVLGIDQKTCDRYDLHFDVGYVFARRIEYDDQYESFAPDDTFAITLTGGF